MLRDVTRRSLERLLDTGDLSATARRVTELRIGGAQAAAKKVDSLLARAGDGDRVRGAFKYHGSATGRYSAEGVQPQNLKRSTLEDVDAAIAAVMTGDEHVRKLYPHTPVLALVGDLVRPMIIAAPRHVLIGADFSSIESCVLAFLADESWKLDAYRRFYATQDPADEPYRKTAATLFGVSPAAVTKEQRAVGKICDLAFGYQGGVKAFRAFQPDEFTDAEVEAFKTGWRAAHPAIVRLWHTFDRAAVLAVQERGQVVDCGRVFLKCRGGFLRVKLPSGRVLSYPQPRIIKDKRGKPRVVFADNANGKFVDCRFGQGAYGGLWVENVTQAVARDLLTTAMLRVESAGYPIVLHVHDEVVCEVPEGFGSLEEFTRLMCRKPAWALELPIAASAWVGLRYCK